MQNLFFILSIIPFLTFGQEATIHFDLKNTTAKNVEFSLYGDYANPEVLFGETYIYVPITNGKLNWTYPVNKPIRISAYIAQDSVTEIEYSFFLSPGDDMTFKADGQNILASMKITGIGSENNQPLIQSLHDQFLDNLFADYNSDTLPNKVLKAIEQKAIFNRKIFKDYTSIYQPTEVFLKNETIYMDYFISMCYSSFKGNRRYHIGKAYSRNEKDWQNIEDSLTTLYSNNNAELLNISTYAAAIEWNVLRIKEKIWFNPELEQEYWQNASVKKLLESDKENILREKVIDKHYTGEMAEFLYAVIFQESSNPKDDNLPEIFDRFKKRYPASIYIPFIEPRIARIIKIRKNVLQNETILIFNTDSLQTFEDILELVKGKTVLLDMWGTWCGPCRRDLSNHSEEIKSYYKDKPLDYLYIANYDIQNEDKWRELIPYYNLIGTHILANENLTMDITDKINSFSFPTYVIIKKDGTFIVLENESGLQLEVLFKQIDRILNE